MAKTRSKAGTASATRGSSKDKPTSSAVSASRYALAPEAEKPPRLLILPESAAPGARIVTLQHPRYAQPTRYLACPESGLYELTRIAAPKSSPRSWLLVENARRTAQTEGGKDDDRATFPAQVAQDADLYVASPFDPLFLVLPALMAPSSSSSSKSSDAPKRMFLSSDDHLDGMPGGTDGHLATILRWPALRKILEARIAAVCDTVVAGDEPMFRLSETKLVASILAKAERMSEAGLPGSMEERFVAKVLEAPIMGVRSLAGTNGGSSSLSSSSSGDDGDANTLVQTDSADSQSSVSSTETSATSASAASTAATSVSGRSTAAPDGSDVVRALQAPEKVIRLQRLRVAFGFICSSYVAPPHAARLQTLLATEKALVDFAPLEEYLAQLAKLKQEAVATRASDYSCKRAADEEADERAEKRRRKEDEEKQKKASESRGVKELRKVNTRGMKKMSEFFKKK